jgi:hypothetical protein
LHPKKQFPHVFLDEVSYEIDLGKLYELRRTTFYHGRMPYVAVVMKIKDRVLNRIFKGEFLL